MFGKLRKASKSIFQPTKDSRRGLIFNQHPQPRQSKRTGGLLKRSIKIVLALFSVSFVIFRFGPRVESSLIKISVASPYLQFVVQGNSDLCGPERLREVMINHSAESNLGFEDIAGILAKTCNADKVEVALRAPNVLRISLQRLPNVFVVECSKFERRLVSRSLRIISIGEQSPPEDMVRLEGFDKVFCRSSTVHSDSTQLANGLVDLLDRIKGRKERLSVIRSRLPRGAELFFEGLTSSFIVKLDANSSQYRKLDIALQSKWPAGSIVSLDMDGKMLISQMETLDGKLE
jgi:hypothetical protein